MISTCNASDFSNVEPLVQKKVCSGHTIAVIIPALNEERTIGPIVKSVCSMAGLIDAVYVIDGGSSDATASVAKKNGAQVAAVSATAQANTGCGKGYSMKLGLQLSKESIVVFIDADIQNFHQYFILGLIGPLLMPNQQGDQSICFTRACYRRPLLFQGQCWQDQGGRVSEILVRPLLRKFFPPLAQVAQPLAGEYAMLRDIANQIDFAEDYGVEISILLSYYKAFGLQGMIDVICPDRIHRNRTVASLGKMSDQILETFLRYCDADILQQHVTISNKTSEIQAHLQQSRQYF